MSLSLESFALLVVKIEANVMVIFCSQSEWEMAGLYIGFKDSDFSDPGLYCLSQE